MAASDAHYTVHKNGQVSWSGQRGKGGREAAERIRADADREARVILAEAERDGQKLRGEGDARSTEIYANAFGEDEEFYAFTRSLQAYGNSFGNSTDVMVLNPTSSFFDYFGGDTED